MTFNDIPCAVAANHSRATNTTAGRAVVGPACAGQRRLPFCFMSAAAGARLMRGRRLYLGNADDGFRASSFYDGTDTAAVIGRRHVSRTAAGHADDSGRARCCPGTAGIRDARGVSGRRRIARNRWRAMGMKSFWTTPKNTRSDRRVHWRSCATNYSRRRRRRRRLARPWCSGYSGGGEVEVVWWRRRRW